MLRLIDPHPWESLWDMERAECWRDLDATLFYAGEVGDIRLRCDDPISEQLPEGLYVDIAHDTDPVGRHVMIHARGDAQVP